MRIPFLSERSEDEEEYTDRDEKLPSKRKFKDLKSEYRKSRKEPHRPWGNKERLFVALVLLSTIIASAIGGLSARSWKLPGLPKFKLPEFKLPSLTGIIGETIVIEKNDDGEKIASKADEITTRVSEITENLSGIYAFYLIDLDSDFSFGLNEDEVMTAASLVKLPVMVLMYREAELGNLKLNTEYLIKDSDKISGSGSLSGKAEGTSVTYKDLVYYMGHESDNTAFNIARKILGDKETQDYIDKIGMASTTLTKNLTTPHDVGSFFRKLWNKELISVKSRDEILEVLTDTIYENFLPRNVDEEVMVSHKYGREIHVINDAGIVFTEKPFVLVVMTEGIVENEAEEYLPKVIKQIYDGWIH